MGKHDHTTLDRARDELYSHIVRCDVLAADEDEHVREWLEETMAYMAERYPDLSELQLAQLRMMGERFVSPVIEHGRGNTANSPESEDTAAEPGAEATPEEAVTDEDPSEERVGEPAKPTGVVAA